MNTTNLGLIVGIVLGLAGAIWGFGTFLIVLFCGAVGLGVGRYLDGQLDLSQLTGGRQGARKQ